MVRVLLVLALAALLAPASAAALPPGFTETTPWTIPDYATAVRFAPDGHVFVAAKGGTIYVFDGLDDSTPTVFADLSREVFAAWDRGLLGLAIDPQYATGRPYLYVAYTYDKAPGDFRVPRWSDTCPDPPGFDQGCVVTGRVSRIGPDGSETVLVEDFCDQSASHSMGALQFGPDGALYVSAGDGAAYNSADYGGTGDPPNPCGDPPGRAGTALSPPTSQGGALRAQSYRRTGAATLDGAILRIDPDTGAAFAGNPGGPDDLRRRIVAYGFRNPFRFAFRPGTGELWVGDVGFGAWEEIDRVPDMSAVRNYGWPCYEGDEVQDSYAALGLTACTSLPQAATVQPFYAYSHGDAVDGCSGVNGSSLSGMTFYDADAFPATYRGKLFFADYSRGCIWTMAPDDPHPQLFTTADGPVDLQVGPDGALYYADVFEGQIRRIAPTGGAPAATIAVDHDSGGAPLTVHFTAGPAAGVTYAWDLDGDGQYDDSTSATPSFTYTQNGYVTVRLRVTNAGGASGTATRRITVGTPPRVTIAAPTAATTWAVGDTVAFSGSAVNGASAALPASGLRWTLDMRHCPEGGCHTHRIQDFVGVASGSFVAPDHEYPSHLELTLTATDAAGLTSTQTVALEPRTTTLSVTSTPPGAQIGLGTGSGVTPFSRAVIANSQTAISAASPQSIGAASYAFGAWGDGGAATHLVRAACSGTQALAVRFDHVTDALLAGSELSAGLPTSQANPGRGEVYRLPPVTTSGTALALRLYLDPTSRATSFALGLYSDADGEAGALLGSGTLTTPQAGWNEVRLAAPVRLAAGTRYWFALLNPSGGSGLLVWRDHAGAPDLERTSPNNQQLAALPSTWVNGNVFGGGPVAGGAYGLAAGSEPSARAAAAAAVTGPCSPASPTPTPTPGGTQPSPPATPQPKPKPKPAVLARLRAPASLRMTRGIVTLRIACPQACQVTATLSRSGRRVGRATGRAKAKHTLTLRVHLSAKGRALVRQHKTLALRLTRRIGAHTQTTAKRYRVRR